MIKQVLLPLLGVMAFIVIVGIYIQKTSSLPKPTPLSIPTVSVGNTTVRVEIANTQMTRAKGLSSRSSLEEENGMLFVFETQNVTPKFWMKDMLIPLDIIWINDDKIVKIDKNIQPNELQIYTSNQPIDYVLEVNGGFSEKKQIKVGDSFVINN